MVVACAAALAEAVPRRAPAGGSRSGGRGLELERPRPRPGRRRLRAGRAGRGSWPVCDPGRLLDLFPATEDRAVRVDLFGDEIESLRWFSTFTQRSLGDAEWVEVAPAAELAEEHREMAEISAIEARKRAARPRAWPRPCRSSASAPRSTWCPRRPPSSSRPPRRWSLRCATTGRTRRPRCTPMTPATSTSTSPARLPSARRFR